MGSPAGDAVARLLSAADVAKVAGVSHSTAMGWLKSRKHPLGGRAFDLRPDARSQQGRMRRVTEADFVAWLRGLRGMA